MEHRKIPSSETPDDKVGNAPSLCATAGEKRKQKQTVVAIVVEGRYKTLLTNKQVWRMYLFTNA